MKINRQWLLLSGVLLTALTGWLIPRVGSDLKVATKPSPSAPTPVDVADATLSSAPSREFNPHRSRREAEWKNGNEAFNSSDSPDHTQDLDRNRDWARKFPETAMAWLRTAPDGSQRDTVAEMVCPQLAQSDPAAGMDLAASCLGNGTNAVVKNLLDNIAKIWAEQDQPSASAWAMARAPGEERDRLLGCIAVIAAKADPYHAAQLITGQISPGSTQTEAAIGILYQWAHQDERAALAWAESFPPGDTRDRAVAEVKNVSATLREIKNTF